MGMKFHCVGKVRRLGTMLAVEGEREGTLVVVMGKSYQIPCLN